MPGLVQAEHLTRLSDLRLLVLAEGFPQANVTSGSQPLTILQVGRRALSKQAQPQLAPRCRCRRTLQEPGWYTAPVHSPVMVCVGVEGHVFWGVVSQALVQCLMSSLSTWQTRPVCAATRLALSQLRCPVSPRFYPMRMVSCLVPDQMQ